MRTRLSGGIAIGVAALAAVAVMAPQSPAASAATPSAAYPLAFTSPVYQPSLNLSEYPNSVAIGDVTGDGRADVVQVYDNSLNGATDTEVVVYAQTAAGKLAAPVITHAPIDVGRRPLLTIADVYGTGKKEVLVPGFTSETNEIAVFAWSGGKLAAPTMIVTPQPGAIDVQVADMNGDGHPDLVTTPGDRQTVQIFNGSAKHTFTLAHTLTMPLGNGAIFAYVRVADLDGNGRPDIALLTGPSTDVRLQTAQGVYGTAKVYTMKPNSAGNPTDTRNMVIGDLNGDGHPDLIMSSPVNANEDPNVQVFLGTGTGTFKAPVVYAAALDTPDAMIIADMNGDGRPDLVVQHEAWGSVGVYLQNANHTLAAEQLFPLDADNFGPYSIAVGDLNGDGKPDIAGVRESFGVVYAK